MNCKIWKIWGCMLLICLPALLCKTTVQAAQQSLNGRLFVHCGAGMRNPIAQLAEEFQQQQNVAVDLSFDGSNRLLGQIKLTRRGDLYIPGDAEYIEMAAQEGLVLTSARLCYFVPVIMVKKGNPWGIRNLSDLLRPGIKIGQADEKAAAVGRVTPQILRLHGIDADAWKQQVVLSTPTVNELGVAIKLGTLDAVLVWSSIALNYPNDADIISIDPEKNVIPEVAGAVLTVSTNQAAASAFLEFLTSDRGRQVLREHGYVVEKP